MNARLRVCAPSLRAMLRSAREMRRYTWLLVALMLLVPTDALLDSHAPLMSYDNLKVETFSKGKLYYRKLLLDRESHALYVGAMNRLFKLYAFGINDTSNDRGHMYAERVFSPPAQGMQCPPSEEGVPCGNHFRVLEKIPGKKMIYACGANGGGGPRVYNISTESFTVTPGNVREPFVCHPRMDTKSVAIWVERGNPGDVGSIYASSLMQHVPLLLYRPPLIDDHGNTIDRRKLLMEQDGDFFNHGAEMVGAIEDGEFVYFFGREPAREQTLLHMIYSRIFRVCKNDRGYQHSSAKAQHAGKYDQKFASFQKARINCSVSDENWMNLEIQSVEKVVVGGDAYAYAVFSASTGSLFRASALCTYRITEINHLFQSGDIMERSRDDPYWKVIKRQDIAGKAPGMCHSAEELTYSDWHYKRDGHMFMAAPVPYHSRIFVDNGAVFTSIKADIYSHDRQADSVVVLYLGTDSGQVYKLIHDSPSSPSDAAHAATLQLPYTSPVRDMQVLPAYFLYTGQDEGVTQLPLDVCEQYRTCGSCVVDPFCEWTRSADGQGSCTKASVWTTQPRSCPSLRRVNSTQLAFPGDALHLKCTWPHGVTHSWWKLNGVDLRVDGSRVLLAQNGSLVILKVEAADAGVYECFIPPNQLLVTTVVKVDNVNCKRPGSAQAYHNVYKEWCRAFQSYQQTMEDWKKWHSKNSKCMQDATFTGISGSSDATGLNRLNEVHR